MARTPLALPDFPWNQLEPAKAVAASHPEGMINLSVGSPVDPVAPGIQLALAEAAAAPGYPQTIGTPALREAITGALSRRYGCEEVTSVLPVVGTKEAIAWLPKALGVRGTVLIPTTAYPTYEVAALLAGATPLRCDAPWELPKEQAADVELIFINSPSNPTGQVLGEEHLARLIDWCQERGVVLASDECYLGLVWEGTASSVLSLTPNHTNLIAIHSLSKTSNMASYRAGFFAGCPALIAELTEVRKHAGLMVPGPIQAAMVAALVDDQQENLQELRYAKRRAVALVALIDAGFEVHHSEAGLYLWVTRGEDCWDTVNWFAQRGILVAPGAFYGPEAATYVRVALTASDEEIAALGARLR